MSAIYDYLRAVAIVVAFIAAKQSKKAAWSFDLILTAWFGMGCFLFPQTVVSKVFESPSDPAVGYGVQTLGACFLGVACFQYLCLNSRDDTVIGSIALSKALGFVPLLATSLYTYVTYQKKVDHAAFCFLLTIYTGIWLINVMLLVETRPSIGRREQRGPKMKETMASNYLVQSIGVLLISNIFTSWYAPCFLRKEDKKSFIVSQIVFVGLLTLASVYYCNLRKENTKAVLLQIGHSLVGGILPAVGYFLLTREDRVPTNSYFTRSKSS
ncbi:uncharacterized protein LOC125659008 isoform X1 [Ostrea edulis]|uniref:uncharacterized protein LOC125659008 isoform X1 n=1 Tax=Ostrea edulis TaxID=37623 RepID=UPI0024AF3BBA|nr:uncharacterized protein LOC125659008 isoform X1 [Ostrea edulis]